MVRFPRLPFAAAALVLAVGCSGDDLTPPAGGPLAEFSDGANAGNPDFFFLPPMFRSPTNHPNFTAGAFNAQLQARVEICRLEFLPDNSLACVAGPPVQVFEGAAITVSTADEQYQVNWNTDESALELDAYYRIEVFAGGTSLGFADMDPVGTGRELRNVQTGEYIGLVDGRTLPIKFRIESGALCDPPGSSPCTSQTIDLTETSVVVLEETGDQVTIPAQNTLEGEITVTLERCEDENGNPTSIDVDLPVFGNCLRITTDRELDAPLSPPATVSMCRLLDVLPELSDEQRHLLTLHRQDGDVIQALPHAPEDFCPSVGDIGAAPRTGLRGFAATGWRLIRRGFAAVFAPRTLYARTVMLDVGELGGFTQDFSDFQFALPAKMTYVNPDDASRTAPPGTVLPTAVAVTDAHGDAVAGATVRFIVPAIEGAASLLATTVTGSTGIAQVDWTIAEGPNGLIATGRGIASSPGSDGPAEGFDPFTPLVDPDLTPEERALQDPVTLGVGAVPFSATGVVPQLGLVAPVGGAAIVQNNAAIGCSLIAGQEARGFGYHIAFDWTDVAGAASYDIVAIHEGASLPIVQTTTTASELPFTQCNSFVPDANLEDWGWTVTARDAEGEPLLTGTGTFTFEPCRHPDGQSCGIGPISGLLTDPAGDAGTGADIVWTTGRVAEGGLILSARFAGETYTAATYLVWSLDTDQNTATGFPGITSGNGDADQIGADFIVQIRGTAFGSSVTLLRGNFTVVSTSLVPVYVTNGVDVTIPLSLLDGDDGAMHYKATIQTQLTAGSWTGINDFVSNLGLPPGVIAP